MVKKFRRAAAGIDEQLPSDLRPPAALKRTVDYLFNTVIGEAPSLGAVHHFVWDRTRAVRNDFSIQQVQKLEHVRTAIECYERIARFHILSLHQLAVAQKPYDKYDWYQEREQLDRTLLSLVQYYEDNRARYRSPCEAEFRSYCVIFQIQDPKPDLENRVQATWPRDVVEDPRVQRALSLYAAATNVDDPQGPLKPRAMHPIGRSDWRGFWRLLCSNQVSYLQACVAEIYFNMIRQMTLGNIWRSYRQGGNTRTEDWTVGELTEAMAFDDDDETEAFCEAFGFEIGERADGADFLDLTSVAGRELPAPTGLAHQTRSVGVVEAKRRGRTLPAVLSGMTVKAARRAGLIEEEGEEEAAPDPGKAVGQSLFVTGDSDDETGAAGRKRKTTPKSAANPFATAASSSTAQPSPFGAGGFGGAEPALNPFAPSFEPQTKPAFAQSPFSSASAPGLAGLGKPAAEQAAAATASGSGFSRTPAASSDATATAAAPTAPANPFAKSLAAMAGSTSPAPSDQGAAQKPTPQFSPFTAFGPTTTPPTGPVQPQTATSPAPSPFSKPAGTSPFAAAAPLSSAQQPLSSAPAFSWNLPTPAAKTGEPDSSPSTAFTPSASPFQKADDTPKPTPSRSPFAPPAQDSTAKKSPAAPAAFSSFKTKSQQPSPGQPDAPQLDGSAGTAKTPFDIKPVAAGTSPSPSFTAQPSAAEQKPHTTIEPSSSSTASDAKAAPTVSSSNSFGSKAQPPPPQKSATPQPLSTARSAQSPFGQSPKAPRPTPTPPQPTKYTPAPQTSLPRFGAAERQRKRSEILDSLATQLVTGRSNSLIFQFVEHVASELFYECQAQVGDERVREEAGQSLPNNPTSSDSLLFQYAPHLRLCLP